MLNCLYGLALYQVFFYHQEFNHTLSQITVFVQINNWQSSGKLCGINSKQNISIRCHTIKKVVLIICGNTNIFSALNCFNSTFAVDKITYLASVTNNSLYVLLAVSDYICRPVTALMELFFLSELKRRYVALLWSCCCRGLKSFHLHIRLVKVTTGFDGEPGACSGRINQH